MTEQSRFWDTGSYTDENFSEVLNRLFGDGVLSGVTNELAVTASDPAAMSVVVATGESWVHGTWYSNDAAKTLTVTAADPSNPRIDLVILRRTASSNTCVLAVLAGTPAGSPSAPSLTQTAATWEYTLAQIAVGTGVTSIVGGNIADKRPIKANGTPKNGIIFTTDSVAPAGWTEYTAARGRYIVGVPSAGTIGSTGTVGTAMTDKQDVTHTHTGPSHVHAQNMSGVGTVAAGAAGTVVVATVNTGAQMFQAAVGSDSGYVNTGVVAGGTAATGTAVTGISGNVIAPFIQLLTLQKS